MQGGIFSKLPDGRIVQRLDTLGLSEREMIGIEVHHPHMQCGDNNCAWNREQTIDLEKQVLGHSVNDDDDDWFPDEWDSGFLVEIFKDKDFNDLTRGRFTESLDSQNYGLHYDLTNLWVTTEA